MDVVTCKVQHSATPAYLDRHLHTRDCVRNLTVVGHSSDLSTFLEN